MTDNQIFVSACLPSTHYLDCAVQALRGACGWNSADIEDWVGCYPSGPHRKRVKDALVKESDPIHALCLHGTLFSDEQNPVPLADATDPRKNPLLLMAVSWSAESSTADQRDKLLLRLKAPLNHHPDEYTVTWTLKARKPPSSSSSAVDSFLFLEMGCSGVSQLGRDMAAQLPSDCGECTVETFDITPEPAPVGAFRRGGMTADEFLSQLHSRHTVAAEALSTLQSHASMMWVKMFCLPTARREHEDGSDDDDAAAEAEPIRLYFTAAHFNPEFSSQFQTKDRRRAVLERPNAPVSKGEESDYHEHAVARALAWLSSRAVFMPVDKLPSSRRGWLNALKTFSKVYIRHPVDDMVEKFQKNGFLKPCKTSVRDDDGPVHKVKVEDDGTKTGMNQSSPSPKGVKIKCFHSQKGVPAFRIRTTKLGRDFSPRPNDTDSGSDVEVLQSRVRRSLKHTLLSMGGFSASAATPNPSSTQTASGGRGRGRGGGRARGEAPAPAAAPLPSAQPSKPQRLEVVLAEEKFRKILEHAATTQALVPPEVILESLISRGLLREALPGAEHDTPGSLVLQRSAVPLISKS